MKNYNEMLKNAKNIEEVKKIVDDINNDIKDNNKDFEFNFAVLTEICKSFTDVNKDNFTDNFCAIAKYDRLKAFNGLLSKPYYIGYSAKFDSQNNLYVVVDVEKLFSFSNLEKGYRKYVAELDTNGKPIIDKSITIFDALRFYGLTSVFVRNLQKANFEIDKDNGYNLENVVVDGENIFKDIDGKCFSSNSNNSLEKQLNIIVKFFGYDVQMLKKDLPILKIKAQKIKQDKKNAKFSVNAIIDDNSILKFADVIFGVVASRIKGEDIEIITTKPTKED